jgi:glycosyltransferase involved in cell wall biosynthesis
VKESAEHPAISVVLTVYNRERYLNRAVDSLIDQDFSSWELIAVDDGSNDDSLSILKSYGGAVENIKIIEQENRKLPYSRNKGILASKGKYITFLDSDDEYAAHHLKKRIDYMLEHPETDLIHGGVKIIGDEYVRDKDDPNKLVHISKCTVGATFFGKRKVFIDLGGFKEIHYSEDSEFLQRAEKVFEVEKIDFKTYIYHRDIPDSITNTYQP